MSIPESEFDFSLLEENFNDENFKIFNEEPIKEDVS